MWWDDLIQATANLPMQLATLILYPFHVVINIILWGLTYIYGVFVLLIGAFEYLGNYMMTTMNEILYNIVPGQLVQVLMLFLLLLIILRVYYYLHHVGIWGFKI
jgi:hypothetical protein